MHYDSRLKLSAENGQLEQGYTSPVIQGQSSSERLTSEHRSTNPNRLIEKL